jgi:hypothetical protein
VILLVSSAFCAQVLGKEGNRNSFQVSKLVGTIREANRRLK